MRRLLISNAPDQSFNRTVSKKTANRKAGASGNQNTIQDKCRQWNHIHISLFCLGAALLLTVLLGSLLYLVTSLKIPDISSITDYRPPLTSVFYDDRGRVIAEFSRENRFEIPLSAMSELLPKAFVAAEDGRFYHHEGVDGWSILRALIHNIRSGNKAQGGSTITQQVARSLLLSPEKTYTRKIREAILAYRIDNYLPKEDILYLYLNQIYLGEGAYGVEAAARTYFGKSASELNLSEMSLLAGLPQAPSRYNPFKHFKLAKGRQRYVLNRMAADGYITPEQARRAYKSVLLWENREAGNMVEKYFVDQAAKYVESRYGIEALEGGGLKVYTTLSKPMQSAAALAINKGVRAWRRRNGGVAGALEPQAAMVVMAPDSSRVLALIGGTDYEGSQYNRAVQSRRQPGSAFKPLIYAAALESGVTPADILLDEPLQLQGSTAGEFWEPENFSGEFYGPTTVRTGLINSRNIVTIKLLQEIGVEPVRRLAAQMGVTSPLSGNLSLALGTSGVSLLELTTAYTVFAGGGVYRPPVFVDRIVDREGRLLENPGRVGGGKRVLSAPSAYQMTHLLKGVIEEGTGRRARGLPMEAAGKTGTSDSNMDAWFIGYTPGLAAGVWFGFDQHMPLGGNETGGVVAAPVWLDFMKKGIRLQAQQKEDFVVPAGIKMLPMDPTTGEIRTGLDEGVMMVPFREGLLPEGRGRLIGAVAGEGDTVIGQKIPEVPEPDSEP
ncbi:MAG: PBP1A family penicillin-binding protein [Proteobacteria bacterium]|nr:PBP1A family penicillin-binding protein [Pseudomonadota bacterium]MBU1736568.1 PBP1A family penicillin-binding protein [Pseudomonadota bacterium]